MATEVVINKIYGVGEATEEDRDISSGDTITFSFKTTPTGLGGVVGDPASEAFQSVKRYNIYPHETRSITPGSFSFMYNGQYVYADADGNLVSSDNPITGEKTFIGTINWTTGIILINDSATGDLPITISGGQTMPNLDRIGTITFRTPGAPIVSGQFTITAIKNGGVDIWVGTGQSNGLITGDNCEGMIDYLQGFGVCRFGQWVPDDATAQAQLWYDVDDNDGAGNVWEPYFVTTDQVTINCVVTSYLPLDENLLGLNPVRLPSDGRVPIFRDGDIVLIHHTLQFTCPNPVSADEVVTLPRQNLSLIECYDANDLYVPETDNYTVDLELGTVTFANPLDLSAYVQPLVVLHRIEDLCLASDVQVTGHVALASQITHDYPANDTLVSSVLASGDLQARIYNQFFQDSWTGVWSDSQVGDSPLASYDILNYPIIITNENSTQERFAAIFQTSSTVQIVGEHLGIIYQGGITSDIAPVNPQTGNPYFTIRNEGWGAGWSAGDVFRFNLAGGGFPYWFCRTTLQGPAEEASDHYIMQLRGDSA